MGLINPILVNKIDANDSTAVGGSAGSLVYQINTTTNRCDVFIYYQAKDISNAAIINGSVLEPADINFTTGTGDRAGGSAITGLLGASHAFLGIAKATMTVDYYGYAQRSGRCTGVNTAGVTTAVGDLLTISATDLRATQFLVIATGSPTGTLIEDALAGTLGWVSVLGATSTSTVQLSPFLNLVV